MTEIVPGGECPMPEEEAAAAVAGLPTWEMVDALERALDCWEEAHSPLDDAALCQYTFARTGLNHLRALLPPREP